MGNSVHKVDNFLYPSGNTYSGDMRGKDRHGFGTFTWADDGCTYTGQWVNNQQHGEGKMTFKNGNFYQGEFNKNNIHGRGTLTTANGEEITGVFRFLRRILTIDGPQFPVGEYQVNVDVKQINSSFGVAHVVHYNGPATLHLFSGLLVLPNLANPGSAPGGNISVADLDPNYSFYNAVLVLGPESVTVDDGSAKESKDGAGNLAVVEAVPVVNAVPVAASSGVGSGVQYGQQDETYNKEVRFVNKPVNPLMHMF